ncbi:LysR family transcriptional regulator [Pollutimonas bauzanensis]|uniref:LysR family transcriptional regulator n=1 Tax=Pollutimonas bauzanensis TaxID=658167 RepID=UPI00333EC7B2
MDKFAEILVFLSVVEEGSFSAAGRKLLRTPSSVSKIIARLESRLAVRLFDRIAGTIRLTQEGHRFHEHGRKVVDAMTEAENSVTPNELEMTGVLHIHTSLTFAKYQLAPLLPLLLKRHPGLRIEFIIGTDRGDFLKRDIDVAIHSGSPTELSLVGKPLFLRRWIIAAAPSYLKRYGSPAAPEELHRHHCLNFTVRQHWNSWIFIENGVPKTVNIQGLVGADQGELLRTLALVGLGIVRLAEFHIATDIAEGRLVQLLADYPPAAQDMMYVLYPRGRAQAPRVRAFLQFLNEHFAA